MSRTHGRILEVTEETLGSVLVADAAAGATVLYVDDAADFEDDGAGGWLEINDQVVAYTLVDDDAGTITLATGLTAAAEDGDPVHVWSKLYDGAATLKTALVQVDGEDDNTDPIVATLADAVQDLPEGLRGEAGENCTLQQVSPDEWEVTAVGGRPSSTKGANALRFDEDSYTVTGSGDQTFSLTHEPVEHSEHLYWNGVYQPASEWSRDGKAVTVQDPGSVLTIGDQLSVEYAYNVSVSSRAFIPLGYRWRYATGLGSSTSYAQPGFDDSGWALGATPFGWRDTAYPVTSFGTTVPAPMDVWQRLELTTSGGDLVFSADRVDDDATIYIDGVQVASFTWSNGAVSVQVPCSAGIHTIAVHGTDVGDQGATDHNQGGYSGFVIEELS